MNGVQEAASSNLVTRTISSVHNRFELWTLEFFFRHIRFHLMYGAGMTPALFLGKGGITQILYADALPGVGLVAAAENAVRQLHIADKAIMNHDMDFSE